MQPALKKHGDLGEALECSRKGLRIFTELAAADPTNWLARANVGASELSIGEVLMLKGEILEAMPHTLRAIAIFEAEVHKSPTEIASQAEGYWILAKSYSSLAEPESSLGKKVQFLREARSWYRKSLSMWQQDPKQGQPNPLGGQSSGEQVAKDLAKCEAMLAKLQTQRPIAKPN